MVHEFPSAPCSLVHLFEVKLRFICLENDSVPCRATRPGMPRNSGDKLSLFSSLQLCTAESAGQRVLTWGPR